MPEIKKIPNFERYSVSDTGVVYGIKGQELTPDMSGEYPRFTLFNSNGKKRFCLHTIVLMTFVGARPKGYQCCHYDGNPLNNNVKNLRWDTISKNHLDAVRHGTMGGENNNSKINKEIANKIRKEYPAINQYQLAKKHSLSQANINDILLNKIWHDPDYTYIPNKDLYKSRSKLDWDKVREIRSLSKTGITHASIAKKFNISQSLTTMIINNKRWIE